jgi:hypothetical protein
MVCINTYRAVYVEGAVNELIDLQESEDEIHLEKFAKGDEN